MPVCAIYARVSDDAQLEGDSLEHQVSYVREFARRRTVEEGQAWATPQAHIYADEAVSGTSLLRRMAAQRLLRAAAGREFDIVLFKGISRFARDTVDALLMLRSLQSCGVRVISLEENFDSQRDHAEFVFTIHSALAQAESEKIGIRVRIGAMEKARSGRWNGQAPDGYILNPATQKLEIDHTQAPVIRRIFALYLLGYGSYRIANRLNQDGQLTRRGHRWSQRTVSRILRNRVYIGDVVYGRRQQKLVVSADDWARRSKKTVWTEDAEDLTVYASAHPPVIERDVFEQVQARMSERRVCRGRSGTAGLLGKGMLHCQCGSTMGIKYNGRGVAYYRCLARSEQGPGVCAMGYVRAVDLEETVLDRVRSDARACLADAVPAERARLDRTETESQAVTEALDRELKRSQALFDKWSEGVVSDAQFAALNQTIRQRVETLRVTRGRLLQALETGGQGTGLAQSGWAALRAHLRINTPDPAITRRCLEVLVSNIQVFYDTARLDVCISYRFANRLD